MARSKSTDSNTAVLDKEPKAVAAQDSAELAPADQSGSIETDDDDDDDAGGGDGAGDDSAPIAPATVLIEVPVAPFDPSAFRSRFLSTRLSQRQADALKCIAAGLKQSHEMLRNEKHVDTPPQAIQWLLEQAASAIEQPPA